MKSPKSYRYQFAILLIAIGSMAILYDYGFNKTFDKKCIPNNADAIAMADVKNIRNHFIFSFLKNPSEWKWNATGISKKKEIDLSVFGIKTPDYLAFFHIENQPITQWFVNVEIENETMFENVISKKHFSKTEFTNGMTVYCSNAIKLLLIKHSNQILVSNIPENQKQIAVKAAKDIFLKKLFFASEKKEQLIDTDNAVTFWFKKNTFLDADGILNLTLGDTEITIDGNLKFKPKFTRESQFSQNPNALLSLGFNFEMIRNQVIIKHNYDKINKITGFDLDSLLVYNPTKTEFLLNKIVEKKDSAISYSYDDDFNPIKKVVVHTNREPSFYFSIQTDNSKKIYNYLKKQNAIDNQNVFVNFPLAQTKASVKYSNLQLEANPIKNNSLQTLDPTIGYLLVHFDKLQAKDWSFLIAKNESFSFLKSFESLKINLSKENNSCHFRASLKTKEEKKLISVMK